MDSSVTVNNFIDGKWQSDPLIPRFEKVNPVSGRVIAQVTESTTDDVHAAIQCAKDFHDGEAWAQITAEGMDDVFSNIHSLLHQRGDVLVQAVVSETGKSKKEAGAEVAKTIQTFQAVQYQKYQAVGEVLPSQDDSLIFTTRYPVGVTAVITPWNFPLYIAAQHLAPAIMGRNTLIFRCSPHVPISSSELARILLEAGLPQKVLSLIHGTRTELVGLLASDQRVDMVSFTGSSETAKSIARAREGKKFVFEGGGNNFQVILADTDIAAATEKAVRSAVALAGQKCVATGSILVEQGALADVVQKAKTIMETMKVGDVNAGAAIGPLVGERGMDLEQSIRESIVQGGELILGGHAVSPEGTDGSFFPPTILVLARDNSIIKKELFAPVLKIIPVKDLNEAITIINDQDYGLAASIFSRDQNSVMQFIRRVRTGFVNVNAATGGSEAHMPFGGRGLSGNGFRLGNAEEALRAFTETKAVKWYPRET